MDAAPQARRELLGHVRELLKAVRLVKNDLPAQHPEVPAGTLGVLWTIESMAGEPATGCHVKDLAARCSLDPSTVSRTVAGLVRTGLVERTADPSDGRASVLTLTAAGRRTLADVSSWADERLADALREWTPEEITALSTLMRRFSADLLTRHDQPLEAAR